MPPSLPRTFWRMQASIVRRSSGRRSGRLAGDVITIIDAAGGGNPCGGS